MASVYLEHYQYHERFVQAGLRQYVPYMKDVERLFLAHLDITKVGQIIAPDIFKFPCFTEELCQSLIREEERGQAIRQTSPYRVDQGFEDSGIIQSYSFNYALARCLCQYVTQHILPIIHAYYRKTLNYIAWPYLFKQKSGLAVLKRDESALRDHHCLDADVVVHIALNDTFSGGGLYFKRQAYLLGDLCKLKTGDAVIFPGRVTHPHRIEPITSGSRYGLYYAVTARGGESWIGPNYQFE